MIFRRQKQKIFCIGRNKTGTTSIEFVLKEFGFKMGNQAKGEILINSYKNYHWKPIIDFCKTAEAFQDAPFSWPYTWMILAECFPKAKFILTLRDEEKWYKSITSFHSKLFANGKITPSMDDLKKAKYRYPGFIWDANRAVWKTPENDIYNKEMMIQNFKRHNQDVLHYFQDKPNFLCIDVSEKDSYSKLCTFLNKRPLHNSFPHLNKTKF